MSLALVVNKANLSIRTLVEKVPESRYSLRTVHFTPTCTEVTDGHMAVRVSYPKEEIHNLPVIDGVLPTPLDAMGKKDSFSITTADAKLIEFAIPKHKTLSILNQAQVDIGDNGHARFGTTELDKTEDGTLIAPVFSATKDFIFPDIDKVLPKKAPKIELGVNAELLIDVLKAALAVKRHEDKKASPFVKLSFINQTTSQTFKGLVMPARL
jgi:hypothetical protein